MKKSFLIVLTLVAIFFLNVNPAAAGKGQGKDRVYSAGAADGDHTAVLGIEVNQVLIADQGRVQVFGAV